MKHKILIAADQNSAINDLVKQTLGLLNEVDTKLFSLCLLDAQFEKKLAVAGAAGQHNKPDLISTIEFELNFDEAACQWSNVEVVKDAFGTSSLKSVSTVADLLVVDMKVLLHDYGLKTLSELLKRVDCPVLLISEHLVIDNLVIVHSGSTGIVSGVKHFLNLFATSLRDLPVSVYVSDPESGTHIDNEKAFISYLKLFFNDIGIQLIHGNIQDNLFETVSRQSPSSLVIMDKQVSNLLVTKKGEMADKFTSFIYNKEY
ncbi:hypothetical protein [Roseivirga pacifica]|uniref:hypothetical protein n=1 Tax=Roseivirga pacifica TaxID=1267423 RepID=UPI003BA9B492